MTTAFTYDGDGKRVKINAGGVVTALGSLYEVNPASGVTATYYYAGSQRVAMRKAQGVTWLSGDHLGSASLATNAAGAKVADERYLPYGATRSGGVPTDYQFTGQRLDGGNGLYYYGARYYDPVVGRFISADTVMPDIANPQLLSRYSYVQGNPVRHVDESGHCGPLTPACAWLLAGAFSVTPVIVAFGAHAESLSRFLFVGHMQQIQEDDRITSLPPDQQEAARLARAGEIAASIALSSAAPEPVFRLTGSPGLGASTVLGGRSTVAPNESGAFSIVDWSGYPGGPRPGGPFKVLGGEEYVQARSAANVANRSLHKADPSTQGLSIHEIQPVKLGGSPTDPTNKVAVTYDTHIRYNRWWYSLLSDVSTGME